MIQTKFRWTVYIGDVLFDVMTDLEVSDLVTFWPVERIDADLGLIRFF